MYDCGTFCSSVAATRICRESGNHFAQYTSVTPSVGSARLSPVRMTTQLDDAETACLFEAVQVTLREWTERLRRAAGEEFPEGVTAFRPEMAVHGRYREPCPDCGTPVQRIRYAENETNYCPRCQTEGVVLADRSLSRLLKDDWPRRIEELEG